MPQLPRPQIYTEGLSASAETADIHGGLVRLGNISGTAGNLGAFVFDEGNKRLSLLLILEDGAKHAHGAEEVLVKYAAGTCLQGDDGHAELLLQGILFLNILILGDDDVRIAGENLLGFGSLGLGAANAA